MRVLFTGVILLLCCPPGWMRNIYHTHTLCMKIYEFINNMYGCTYACVYVSRVSSVAAVLAAGLDKYHLTVHVYFAWKYSNSYLIGMDVYVHTCVCHGFHPFLEFWPSSWIHIICYIHIYRNVCYIHIFYIHIYREIRMDAYTYVCMRVTRLFHVGIFYMNMYGYDV